MAMKFGFSRKVRIVPPVPSTEAGVSQHPTLFWQLHVTASTDFSAQSTSERVESKANFPIPNVSGYQARKSLCALPLPALAHTHGDGAFSSAGRHSAQPLELHYIQSSKAAICRKLMSCKQHCAAASLKRARSAHCRYNYCVWTKGAGDGAGVLWLRSQASCDQDKGQHNELTQPNLSCISNHLHRAKILHLYPRLCAFDGTHSSLL